MSQQQEIERLRDLLKPSPVRLHHVPNWLRRQLLKTVGCKAGMTSGFSALESAMQKAGGRFDHWGSTIWNGMPAFVSEPYLSLADVNFAQRFAYYAELSLSIEPNSWWFPLRTTRLLFTLPKQEAAQ